MRAERGIALKRQAWIAITVVAMLIAVGFVLVLNEKAALGFPFLKGLGPVGLMIGSGIAMLIAIIIAMGFANRPLKHGTQTDGDWIVFATWFWIPFSMVPLIAPIRFVILWRGKFGASTITTGGSSHGGGSSVSYPEIRLKNGEGRPAAVVFLLIIVLQCWVLMHMFSAEIGGFLQKM